MDVEFIAKKFDARNILSKKLDIYSKIFFRDVGNFISTPVWIGPASPDAGVKLLRQLFLQCMYILMATLYIIYQAK